MDRKSNKKWEVICIILIISGLLIQVVNIMAFVRNSFNSEFAYLNYFALALNTLALILALVYMLKGYKKDDAKLYKAFLIMYGESLLVSSACMIEAAQIRPVVTRVIIPNYVMMYGDLMVLACAENLGEKKAMKFAWANFALITTLLVALLITHPGMLRGGNSADTFIDINTAKNFILAAVLVCTTRSKYVDKAERGTK